MKDFELILELTSLEAKVNDFATEQLKSYIKSSRFCIILEPKDGIHQRIL